MTLDELRKLAEARTKGEWAPNSSGQTVKYEDGCIGSYFEPQDSAFIAAFANHSEALLNVADAAHSYMQEVKKNCPQIPLWVKQIDDNLSKLEEIK